jgi:hypothetical protein
LILWFEVPDQNYQCDIVSKLLSKIRCKPGINKMIERINKMIERLKSKEVYTLRVIQTNWMFIRDSNEYKPFI